MKPKCKIWIGGLSIFPTTVSIYDYEIELNNPHLPNGYILLDTKQNILHFKRVPASYFRF